MLGLLLAAALPLSIPFQFVNGQIFLQAQVGNARPGWFILDSGASGCVVDAQLARKLGLKTAGSQQGTGAGKGTYEVRFAPDLVYRLPGLTLPVARSYVIDLAAQTTLQGREVAGILGYDLFDKYAVALDFEAEIMTLSDPDTIAAPGESIPFKLEKRVPHIPVRLKVGPGEPVEVQVLVDSGSADAVDADAMANAPHRLEIVAGVGLGQEFRSTIGRAESVQIGPFKLDAPIGLPGGVALIGTEVLRRFDVVFDYRHSRMFLAPNASLGEPFAMDASGLSLRWTPDLKRFVIHDVAKDTPASEAGLKANDEISTIDNQPAAAFRIDQVQRLFTKAGRAVTLGVSGRTVELHLRKRL